MQQNKTKKLLLFNSFFLLMSHIVVTLASLITVSLIGRFFGSIILGQYSFLLSFTEIFVWISDFGIATLLTKQLSETKFKSKSLMNEFFHSKIILTLISSFFFTIVILFFYKSNLNFTRNLVFFQFYVFFNSFSLFFRSILRGNEIMIYEPIIDIIEKILVVFLIIIVFLSNTGFFALILVLLLTSIFNLIAFLSLALKKCGFFFNRKFSLRKVYLKLKGAFPFAINAFVAIIYFKISILLVSSILGDYSAGIFYAGYGIILMITFLPIPLSSASFPRLAFEYNNNIQEFYHTASLILRIILIIGVPISVGLFVVSEDITMLIYGIKYIESIPVIAIASIYLPFRYIDTQFGTMLSACGFQSKRTLIVSLSAVLTFFGSFLLIYHIGIIGAIITLIISELLMYSLFSFTIWRVFNWIPSIRKVALKPIIAAILMGIFCLLIKSAGFFVVVGLGVLIYFILLFLIGGITKTDIKQITSILRE